MLSQITSVDLIVSQVVTVVTKLPTGSESSLRYTLGNIISSETLVPTNSNIQSAIITEPDFVGTVTTGTTVNNFKNRTFDLPDSSTIAVVDTKTNVLNDKFSIAYSNVVSNITSFTTNLYTTPGTYTWTVPAGVTRINAIGIGGGGGGAQSSTGGSGGNGAFLSYASNITVVPGTTYTIVVGAGGAPNFGYGLNGGDTYLIAPNGTTYLISSAGGAGGDGISWTSATVAYSISNATSANVIYLPVTYRDDTAYASVTYTANSLPASFTLNANGTIGHTSESISTDQYYNFSVSATSTVTGQTITKNLAVTVRSYQALSATGGTITTETFNGVSYKVHTFTNTGTFAVTALNDNPGTVEYLVTGPSNAVATWTSYAVTGTSSFSSRTLEPGNTFISVNVPSSGSNSVETGQNVNLYDHGGPSGNYADGVNGYTVLNATGNASITISGTYATEGSFDFVQVFLGSGTGGTNVVNVSGGGTINYTGAAGQTLTVRFYSDGSVTSSGFALACTVTGMSAGHTVQIRYPA